MRIYIAIIFQVMKRLLIEFMSVRLPTGVSWSYAASRTPQRSEGRVNGNEVEEPPGPREIELTHAIGMMQICGSC